MNASELRTAIREATKHPDVEQDGTPAEPPGGGEYETVESINERAFRVIKQVVEQAQPMTNGGWFISDEVMAQARALTGAE